MFLNETIILRTGRKVKGGGGGVGWWARAFENVVDRKHMTHPFHRPLSRNAETKDFARLTSHPVRG